MSPTAGCVELEGRRLVVFLKWCQKTVSDFLLFFRLQIPAQGGVGASCPLRFTVQELLILVLQRRLY